MLFYFSHKHPLVGSEFDALSVDNGSEDFTILDGFLARSVQVVGFILNFDWEHRRFFESFNEASLVFLLLDVLNVDRFARAAKLSEGESNSLAIVVEVHFGDGLAHKTPDGPSVVQAEEQVTGSVARAHWEEERKHVHAEDTKSILHGGLLDFPWHKLSLRSSTIEHGILLALHIDLSHWSIEFFLLNSGVFLRGSCEKSSWLEVERLLVLDSYSSQHFYIF